jgi:lipoprotein NlpD
VRKGETLYSIAWRYSQDYKSVAYRNKIKPPYKIYAGDKIRLTKTASKTYRKNKTKKAKVSTNKSRKYSSSKASKSKKKTPSKKVASKTTKTKSKNNKRAAKSKNKAATFTGSKRLRWNWPVKGKVIQRYSPGSGKKGIDISAAQGVLIKSAEAGKVVYSGQGLVGYGRLIIIKHNETYLSAYAHNQSLLVNEGQVVKKGQAIARLGRSGTNRYKLHFEIRKNGKPVNPISYLPRK